MDEGRRALSLVASRQESDGDDARLSAEEVQVLLKACQRYRGTIPAYLKSSEAELRILDSIVRKLQASLSGESRR